LVTSADRQRKRALDRENDALWHRFLILDARAAKSKADLEASKARAEREYLRATRDDYQQTERRSAEP